MLRQTSLCVASIAVNDSVMGFLAFSWIDVFNLLSCVHESMRSLTEMTVWLLELQLSSTGKLAGRRKETQQKTGTEYL